MHIPTELADIPLGELQALREKIGTKKFDVVLQKSREEKQKRSFKRANKNRYNDHMLDHSETIIIIIITNKFAIHSNSNT